MKQNSVIVCDQDPYIIRLMQDCLNIKNIIYEAEIVSENISCEHRKTIESLQKMYCDLCFELGVRVSKCGYTASNNDHVFHLECEKLGI